MNPSEPQARRSRGKVPGLTACSLCAGETLGGRDRLEGGQLARLRALDEAGTARLTLVECLDECERGDVVVARPAPQARRAAASPVWLEQLAGEELTADLRDWLAGGGPGVVDVPSSLRPNVFRHVEPPEAHG